VAFSHVFDTVSSLGLPRELVIVAISTLPIFELRGALPIAINVFNLPWQQALLLAIIGNLIPVPLLLLFFGTISRRLKRGFNWLSEVTRRRGQLVERYKKLGLVLLVAIPLPVTGAWTGSLVATISDIDFKHAMLCILTGVCIAGGIVTAICTLAASAS
jgi:uncharacterized membrane protein